MNETTTLFDGQKSVGFGKCYETRRTWDWAFEWLNLNKSIFKSSKPGGGDSRGRRC